MNGLKYINLLPPAEQQKNKVEDVSRQIQDFGIWIVLSLAVLAVVFFVAELFLRGQMQSAAENMAAATGSLNSIHSSSVKKEVEIFNKNLNNFQSLGKQHENWSRIFNELALALPVDVIVDSLVIDREGHKVEAAGHAGKRTSVLKLRQNILASEYFTNINFPLSNLEKAAGPAWKYRFYIKPEKLH